jgi:Zn-dependent protease
MFINAMLAVFNLLPIPPLDGSKILSGLLPPAQAISYDRLQQYGPLLLLVIIMLPGRIFSQLIMPPILWLMGQALGRGGP